MTTPARQFALEVVARLRSAGFEALWAGGCVRDQLLGREPKDYDVATSARPEQVREVFGRRRTLEIGAAFGVVSVLGPKPAGAVEVATFRSDGAYLDGRHPENVIFSTAEMDAQRRDFTINGLFFDPIAEQVIDYVGGQADLEQRIIRAIREPAERFDEDKLRLLRAVRFAATFDFAIEPKTLEAIQQLAGELIIVSAERIAAEMRRMLVHPRRSLAVRLLRESRLLTIILPEAHALLSDEPDVDQAVSEVNWQATLAMLDALQEPSFPTALAVLVRSLRHPTTDESPEQVAEAICRRWKLANEEIEIVRHLLKHEAIIRSAPAQPWPQLQRVLIAGHVQELLTYAEAVAKVSEGTSAAVDFCRERLRWPAAELNPPPLLTGQDLKQLGLRPGPEFRRLLDALRDAQLDKLVHTRDAAIEFVKQNAAK